MKFSEALVCAGYCMLFIAAIALVFVGIPMVINTVMEHFEIANHWIGLAIYSLYVFMIITLIFWTIGE